MLNKRFKIAKCKTSLKLATSRIKLMRNKKGVQINQMKKELAQLLESGQDRTARIRVEHVIREEKMVAAYDLIEIYCELIVARLPIIESQKTCPIDLKEAVTSVIFAAPRCSDIPELVDARKNFTAKYGKEFVSAAIELTPNCGVNPMLVEKLSAVAPDVQTKVKVLTAVAKEHNINWDPTIFENKESKPPDDLLNGPTHFIQTSTINPDLPKIQTSNVHEHVENLNVPIDFSQQNRRFTLDAQKVTDADTGSIHISSTSTTRDDMRSSGMASGMMNTSQSFHTNNNGSSSFTDNWNTEFKDATHAAQAAAESAERASFAARAAAQLSSQEKMTRKYSTESHESHTKTEKTQHSYNTSFNDRKPKIQNRKTEPSEYDTSPKATEYSYSNRNESTKRSNSLRPRNESVNESSVNHLHQEDGYFETHKNQAPSREMSSKKAPAARFKSGENESSPKSEKGGFYRNVDDQENRFIESTKKMSYETDSDDDVPSFNIVFEYDEEEAAKSFFPSPGRESIRPVENPQTWSPKKNIKNVNFSKSVDPSVKSDLSDGPDSESESETSFGTFAGGLRNKGGVKYPHYKKPVNEIPIKVEPVEPISKPSSFNLRAKRSENKKPSVSISSSDSDSDYYSEKKFPVQSPKTRSPFAPPDTFFYNYETDHEEEMPPVPKRTSSGKVNVSSGVSLRTKGKTILSKQSPPEHQPHMARFKQEPSGMISDPKVSEQPTSGSKKIVQSSKAEAVKTPNLSSQTSLEGSNGKKPSHVHPNLPDYDSLAARIQSLQANRQ